MANIEDEGLLKKGMTLSVRNIRMIDRSLLRNRNIHTAAAAFYVFEGAEPDYYDLSGVPDTTKYGYGGNLELTYVNGPIKGSQTLWENGILKRGPVVSGTILNNPREFYDRSTTDLEPTITVDEAVISGGLTITIPSGEIKNLIF